MEARQTVSRQTVSRQTGGGQLSGSEAVSSTPPAENGVTLPAYLRNAALLLQNDLSVSSNAGTEGGRQTERFIEGVGVQ